MFKSLTPPVRRPGLDDPAAAQRLLGEHPPALATVHYENRLRWEELQRAAEELYLHLVDTKQMKKEDARYILPQGSATSMNITGNFQMWKDIIANRASKHAQWEVREVFTEIDRQMGLIAPSLFGGAK